jgi:hypothetical protein
MAIRRESTKAVAMRISVLPRRPPIIDRTPSPVLIDDPQLPCKRLKNQWKYWM